MGSSSRSYVLRAETSPRVVRRRGCTEQFCNEISGSSVANACYRHRVGAIAASIDGTPGQVFADALLVVAVGVNAYLGWSHGMIRRIFSAVGVFVAVFAAANLGNAVASLVHAHDAQANAWSFVSIFLFVIIVFEVLGALLNERLEKIAVAAFDRFGGVLVGAVVGVAEVLILFLVAISVNATPPSTMSQDIHAATLSGQVVRLEPQVRTLFGPVLPSNLSDHFDQNAPVAPPPVGAPPRLSGANPRPQGRRS